MSAASFFFFSLLKVFFILDICPDFDS